MIEDAARLTRFAVVTRYPGVAEPVPAEEHLRAVAIAEVVVRWAEGRIKAVQVAGCRVTGA